MVGRRQQQNGAADPDPYILMPDQMVELVLREPMSGRIVRLGVMGSLRDFEVLGSAGMYYAKTYENADRPESQVGRRRARAKRVGEALWTETVNRIGIEEATQA